MAEPLCQGARTTAGLPSCHTRADAQENHAIGTIALFRATPGPSSEKQISLLKTFADQAVIAIENVRLFKELQAKNAELTESLRQQTATAEILKVISSSPTDTQPVFDAIVGSGSRLFGGAQVRLSVRQQGELVSAASNVRDDVGVYARSAEDESFPGARAMMRREIVDVPDLLNESWVSERSRERARQQGRRAITHAPLLSKGEAIGTINVSRVNPGPLPANQIALLKTFADQAVIAIENVRLFKELQARNAEVTEALEQQTATAEILRVISSSPTNLQPVFDAILQKATQLCDSHLGLVGLFDGEYHRFVAVRTGNADVEKWAMNRGPFRPRPGGGLAQLLRDGKPYQEADLRESAGYQSRGPMNTHLVERGRCQKFSLCSDVEGGTCGR